MRVCVFYGNRDCPDSVLPELKRTLIELIEACLVTDFYVGNHGQFDYYVRRTLADLSSAYPYIRSFVVLAYAPLTHQSDYELPTLLPEGIECVPKKFAIVHRNRWMLKKADYVVTYTANKFGNSFSMAQKALKAGKNCIELYHPTT